MTTQEQLDELQTAKTLILTKGQAYTADGLQMTRANLSDLTKEIERLERKLAAESRSGFSGGGIGYGVPGM